MVRLGGFSDFKNEDGTTETVILDFGGTPISSSLIYPAVSGVGVTYQEEKLLWRQLELFT